MAALDLDDVFNPPPDHLKAAILKDIGEDEGRLEHNLGLLESWISCQSHLPKNYEKKLLISFLRGSKHDMQRAKKRLESFIITRSFEETLFRNRVITPQRDLIVSKHGFICPMPEMTPEGYRITLSTVISKNDYVSNVSQFLRYLYMFCDLRLHYDAISAGEVFVWDSTNLSTSNSTKLLCPEFWKMIDFGQNIFPFRLKQIHLIITNSVMVKIADMFKQVLSDKLAKRVYIHSNWESVFKVVPQKLFPSDYGGEKKSTLEMIEQWNRKFVELEGWFQGLEDLKVSGPIPKEFVFSEVYGAEGSFRQINLD